jgi:filamentous hemagglutinin family protein
MNLLHQTAKSQLEKQFLVLSVCCLFGQTAAFGQSITPATDGTGTVVNSQGNQIDISGGKVSGDGANLFHSFQQFGLSESQIANFISNPAIQNILGRIVGGDASVINGLIQVTGGNSNLFLINPAGIIFGANAQLNVPASFTATTANSIGFGSNSFNAIGSNNYTALTGSPSSFVFSASQPASIVNLGNLAVNRGGNLNLLGGTVINIGQVSAPDGQINIIPVPGKSVVRISQPGYLLSIEVSSEALNSQTSVEKQENGKSTSATTIPELLTGGGDKVNATGVAVNSDGTVQLTDSAPNNSPPNNLAENNSATVTRSSQQINTGSPTNSPPNTINGGTSAPPTNTESPTNPTPNNTNGGTSAPPTNTESPTNPTPNNINGGISPQPNNTGNPTNSPPNNINGGISPQPNNTGNPTNSPPNNTNGGISPQPNNTGNPTNSPPNNINGGISPQPNNTGNPTNSPPNNINGGISPQPNNTGNPTNSPPNNTNGGISPQPNNTGNPNSTPNNNNEMMSPEPTNPGNPNSPPNNSNGSTSAPPTNTGNQNSPPNNSNGGNPQTPGNSFQNNSVSPTVLNGNISAPNNLPVPIFPPGIANTIRTQGNSIQTSLLPNIQPNTPMNGQLMSNNNFGLIPNNIQVLSLPPIINNQGTQVNILQTSILPPIQPNSLNNGQLSSKSQSGVSPNNNIQILAAPGIAGDTTIPPIGNGTMPPPGPRGNIPGGKVNIPTSGANPVGNLAALSNLNYLLSVDRNRADRYSNYFGENITSQPIAAENIRDTLSKVSAQTKSRSAIIYVNLFSDRLELLLFTPDGNAIRKTVDRADRTSVLTLVTEFRQEISNPRKRNTTSYKEVAKKLYDLVIAPLETDLQSQGINTLLFSLDTGLRSLPLAALYDGKQFLVEKYSLAQIPTISLTDTRYQSLQNASVLAMGSAQFTQLSPLPAVPVELANIIDLWQGKSFLNEQFTLKNLKDQRDRQPYQIIHLATHSEFQPGAASDSYIQLWDTKLPLNDLRKLGWNNPPVELLVLSACRTALGDEKTELGFAGFAFQAGVKSVLASLWYVSDEGTLALMSEFYQQLKTAPIKAEALRQAQIAMIKGQVRIEQGVLRGSFTFSSKRGGNEMPISPEFASMGDRNLAHPYYWAAFTMIGSPW